jgi:Leucine-rich repeat (LRR) protein
MTFFALRSISISKNDPASFWPAVFKNQKSIDLYQKRICDKRMEQIALTLKSATKIEILSFTDNQIGDNGLLKLGQALAKHPSLTELYLGQNKFSFEAFENFLVLIQDNKKLQSLDLNNNCLRTKGAIALCNFVSTRPQFTAVAFAGNHIGDEGAIQFAALIAVQPNINYLYLNNNNITDIGATALLNALSIHQTITTLELDANSISQAMLAKINEQLEFNRQRLNTAKKVIF